MRENDEITGLFRSVLPARDDSAGGLLGRVAT